MCEYTEKGVHVGFIDRCIHSTVQALLVILLLVQALIERKPNTIGLARTVYMYTVYDRIRILRIYIICIECYIIYINIIIPCVRYILCTAVCIYLVVFPPKVPYRHHIDMVLAEHRQLRPVTHKTRPQTHTARAYSQARTHMQLHTYIHTYVRANTHTHAHKHAHTHTNTHTCTQTRTA